jgi:hypothetical protein
MIRSVSAEAAAQNKFLIEGPGPKAWIHNYISEGRSRPDGSPRVAGDMSPMIYLVDQEPNSAIQMHFHQVDQYQIVVGGSGGMGRHSLAPITVHYTNAFTGYGPLRAGPAGLQYLTIRSRWDPGLRALPEAKDELPPAGSYKLRQRTTEPCPALNLLELADLKQPWLRRMMQEGEAEAWRLALPPGASAPSPAHTNTDQVLVLCAGSLANTAAGEYMSCHFVPAGEEMTLVAGAQGADVLILQFPNRKAA